ncbi:MAG: DUF86 domain-containing protein [Methanothrix sp.]|jgi:uncharacterized protein with HEPN domain|nr:DUF86 domain-containing protein [Methanothrix sp.]
MKDDKLYLIHIWECIQRIESYSAEGKVAFLASNMMQDAIIRNFEIIGEATKHLSPELRQSHPEIQWRGLAGFRDVLIHNYMGVDLDEIWNIIENELPQIKSSLKAVLVEIRLLRAQPP